MCSSRNTFVDDTSGPWFRTPTQWRYSPRRPFRVIIWNVSRRVRATPGGTPRRSGCTADRRRRSVHCRCRHRPRSAGSEDAQAGRSRGFGQFAVIGNHLVDAEPYRDCEVDGIVRAKRSECPAAIMSPRVRSARFTALSTSWRSPMATSSGCRPHRGVDRRRSASRREGAPMRPGANQRTSLQRVRRTRARRRRASWPPWCPDATFTSGRGRR